MNNLREHFPDAIVLKEFGGDVMLCDREIDPRCGFMSLHETRMLVEVAKQFPGVWLEIGSHVGWSAAHIAAAGNRVKTVDPAFERNETMLARARENWARLGAVGIQTYGVTSREYFRDHLTAGFSGVLIDGDHSAPEPLHDAMESLVRLETPGVIVLHDSRGQPIRDAVEWLAQQGMQVRTFETMNGLAVAWRGKDLVL